MFPPTSAQPLLTRYTLLSGEVEKLSNMSVQDFIAKDVVVHQSGSVVDHCTCNVVSSCSRDFHSQYNQNRSMAKCDILQFFLFVW